MHANGADEELKCELHGDNEATGTCAECGKAFCAIEVEKSGQSVYCPDCYNATLDELLEGYERLKERESDTVESVKATESPDQIPMDSAPAAPAADPYFALGPDEDFSFLTKGGPRRKATSEPPVTPTSAPETPEEVLEDVVAALMAGAKAPAPSPVPQAVPRTRRGFRGLRPRKAGVTAAEIGAAPAEDAAAQEARVREAMQIAASRAMERAEIRREREARWGFLAQPRAVAETSLGRTKPRVALFVILTTVVAALLWALPNALLVKGDNEYGLHAIAIGALVGIALWWRAGKKHSTRLAWEAVGITVLGIVLGEMLHWTIVIWKEQFFRTVFDIISFKFFFTHLPEVMGKIFPEMFPLNFLWILVLPALVAFVIGFGTPPIPEIFGQLWRALRHGRTVEPESANGS